jgi:GT2 family glycosyltransferase
MLIRELLADLQHLRGTALEIVLTINVPESLPFDPESSAVPIQVIHNAAPKGFGANHNAAFGRARGDFFCVANPDVRVSEDPFPALIACLDDPRVGVAAPLVRAPDGSIEDSARRFPTPGILLAKLFRRILGIGATPDYPIADRIIYPDWVAGMFMIFKRETFARLGGFDEKYFLYYEDVDICARLRAAGLSTAQVTHRHVVHAARRTSHTNLRHAGWHLRSMLRFFRKGYRSQSLRVTSD